MAFIIINLFVDMFAISFVLLFVSVVLQGIFSGAFSNNDFALEKTANKTWLDCNVYYPSKRSAKMIEMLDFEKNKNLIKAYYNKFKGDL